MDLEEQIAMGHLLLKERKCRVCGETKNLLAEYYRIRKNMKLSSSYSYECKECTKTRIKQNYRENPDIEKNRHLKRNYNMTLDDYNILLEEQNSCCAICGTDKPGGWGKAFAVDHDHKTGKVRGLLCKSCNIALGEVDDSLTTLKRMIEYLSA